MTSQADIDAQKAALRHEASSRRGIAAAETPYAAERLADAFFAAADRLDLLHGVAMVSGYLAMKDEIDPAPLLSRLHRSGIGLCLPVVTGRDRPLVFRQWMPGQALVPGVFSTRHPDVDAPERMPDLLLVPLLAFDRRGGRLGYGGGYYDRSLAELRAGRLVRAVGVAYSAQEVGRVPTVPTDAPLDFVATEAGVLAASEHGTVNE